MVPLWITVKLLYSKSQPTIAHPPCPHSLISKETPAAHGRDTIPANMKTAIGTNKDHPPPCVHALPAPAFSNT